MSISDQITRISGNISDTYAVLGDLGATMPATLNSDNLAATAATVSVGGCECSSGTWTATINGGTISAQKCTYLKVDNMCTISFMVEGTGYTASPNVFMNITGVPFAPSTDARWYGGGGHQQGLGVPTGYHFTGFIVESNGGEILARATNDASPSGSGYCYITNGSSKFYMSGSITYPIA